VAMWGRPMRPPLGARSHCNAALLAALRELGDCLSAADVPEGVIATFPSVIDLQTKRFTIIIEKDSTVGIGAPDCIMRLEPSNPFLECLAAAKAEKWPRFIVLVHDAYASVLFLHHSTNAGSWRSRPKASSLFFSASAFM
jgi:hypothetical protein